MDKQEVHVAFKEEADADAFEKRLQGGVRFPGCDGDKERDSGVV